MKKLDGQKVNYSTITYKLNKRHERQIGKVINSVYAGMHCRRYVLVDELNNMIGGMVWRQETIAKLSLIDRLGLADLPELKKYMKKRKVRFAECSILIKVNEVRIEEKK